MIFGNQFLPVLEGCIPSKLSTLGDRVFNLISSLGTGKLLL
jgi:hypothetical protein